MTSACPSSLDEVQDRAIGRAIRERDSGRPSALIDAPTGTGKTRVASLFMDRLVRSEGARFLFLAHRKELVRQTEAHLGMLGIACAVEMADRRAPRPGEALWDVPVVIGSKDTLQKARLLQWPRDSFTDIIIDESHLSLAKSFGAIFGHFACRFRLGLSATPFRMDGRSLFPEPFATRIRAYDPGPRESSLAVAVRLGHLCPLEAITCDLGIDLRGISSRKQAQGRDFAPGELEARIASKVGTIANAVRQELDAIGSRRALLFAPDVPSTVALATALRQVGIPSAAVHGHTKAYPMPDGLRDHRLAQFAEGDLRVLASCELLTTGYNLPSIDAIVMARPTQSIPLFFQMIGRGTRNAPGKDRCCIIGFRWESDDDDAIVSTVDLFLAEESDIRARRLARKLARGPKQLADPELVARRAAEIAEREEERARREAERKLRIAARKKEVRYQRRVFDPLNVGAVFGVRSCTDPGPGDVIPATPQQVAALKHYGMEDCTGLSASQAQKLVESFLDRSFCGLASPRQCRFLIESGRLSPAFVRGLTEREAAAHIARVRSEFQTSRPARAV